MESAGWGKVSLGWVLLDSVFFGGGYMMCNTLTLRKLVGSFPVLGQFNKSDTKYILALMLALF